MNNEKYTSSEAQKKERSIIFLQNLYKNILKKSTNKFICIIYLLSIFFGNKLINEIFSTTTGIYSLDYFNYKIYFNLIEILIGLFLTAKWSGFGLDRTYRNKLMAIGLHNATGIAPILLKKKVEDKLLILTFDNMGIPLDTWNKKMADIESCFNITIDEIKNGISNRETIIVAYNGTYDYSKTIKWSNKYISSNEDELVLGKSICTQIRVNLNKNPHILIGGSTGSGKTLLLKLLLFQCLKKGYKIYISDFKGGIDYPIRWQDDCIFTSDVGVTIEMLNKIIDELKRRQELFKEKGYSNIKNYNKYEKVKLRRIIFSCDEVAELFDTTGMTAQQKRAIQEIQHQVNTLARLGRAFGIHLILATQRPDANIIPGQIKNNIDYKVCGRADNVLSQIILDSTIASEKIPSDSQGMFINQDEKLFKAYYFEENNWGGGTS